MFKAQSPDTLNENTVGIGIYARTNESTVTLSNNIREKIQEVRRMRTELLDPSIKKKKIP